MKNTLYNIIAVTSLAFGLVSCVTEVEPYVPADKPSGDQVYFHKDLKTSFEVNDSTLFWDADTKEWKTSISVAVNRVVAGEAHSFALKCEPDVTIAENVFVCPESVAFAAGETIAHVEITFDRDILSTHLDQEFTVTVTIADEANVSPYGSVSTKISVVCPDPKPWIKWDKGVLTESWWGEKEPGKEMYYQQLNDTIRLCKIEGCFGHDTIEKGEPYETQDYVWYWNTKTNKCYIPCRYMGYKYEDTVPVYYGAEDSFYNDYWGKYFPDGSAEWFAFCDEFRGKYPEDYYPYYDGNGGFYLADYYIVGQQKTGDWLGALSGTGDPCDTFIGNSFTRTTDYNKDLEYKPFADGVDKSALWQEEFPIQVQVAEDPNSVEEAPSEVWYIPGFVNETTGIAFIVAASDTTENATYSIQDAANIQYTDYDIFGKKLGYSIIARKSSITGVPGEYPCELELCVDANLYDVTFDEKGKPEYTLALALGEFVEKITLTNATEVWYNADQLHGLNKEDYVDNYVLYAKDLFDDGADASWGVSVEDAGVIEGVSYLKFKNLVPCPSILLPVNEFLVEWYDGDGLLYFAADEMLGKFNYEDQQLGVTLHPCSSETGGYYDDAWLLGGYYINDEETYACVPFVDHPYNETPVDGFYADVESVDGLCAYYQIYMEFAAPAASSAPGTSAMTASRPSLVPARYEVRTLPEVKALTAGSVTRKNFRVPMEVSPAKERVVRTVLSHSGTIDTSRARQVEKNLTLTQVQIKNNIGL